AADQKHGLHAFLNMLVGVADCVGGGGAAGGDHVAVSPKTEAHADFTGNRSHGSGWDTEEAHLLHVSRVPEAVFLLGKFLCAPTGAEDDADFAFRIHRHRWRVETRIANGLCRRSYGEGHDSRDMFALAGVHPG